MVVGMKYLFIDVISSPAVFVCFGEDKKIISQKQYMLGQKEYDVFLDYLTSFMDDGNIAWKDVGGISTIVGPGPFTGMRIITLTLNTIQLVEQIPLEGVEFFDFLNHAGVSFPALL